MPVPPKPPDKRQRRNNRGDVGLLTAPRPHEVEVPEPRKSWTVVTIQEWNDYFESPLVQTMVSSADLSALRRLFDYRDELQRSLRLYRKERVTTGSTGQPKLSPMASSIAQLERMIAPLEDKFGLTPQARLKLGASLGDAARSLSDMNRELDAGGAGDDDDPRLDVIEGTSNERAEGM